MDTPLVSVVILNFNCHQKVEFCLDSIKKLKYDNLKVILVDNSTNSNSTEYIQKLAADNECIFIRSEENKGYAAGNKLGVDCAMVLGSQYILVLNNDTYLDENVINNLVQVMESDPLIWISGPVLYDLGENGDLTDKIQSLGLKVDKITGKSVAYSNIPNVDFLEREFISGAALLFNRECIEKAGFIDEDFFLYYEETDYCYRLRRDFPNKKIGIVSQAKIWHEPSADIELKEYSLYYSNRNKIIFMKRHFKQTFTMFVFYYFLFSLPKKIIKYITSFRLNLLRVLFKSTCHGLKGKKGIH